jgi:hypothetical protein
MIWGLDTVTFVSDQKTPCRECVHSRTGSNYTLKCSVPNNIHKCPPKYNPLSGNVEHKYDIGYFKIEELNDGEGPCPFFERVKKVRRKWYGRPI